MQKNYFVKSVRYMKNVHQIEHGLNKLSDGRVNLAALQVRSVSCNQNTTFRIKSQGSFLDKGRVPRAGKEALG